jgi:hypothetical protein
MTAEETKEETVATATSAPLPYANHETQNIKTSDADGALQMLATGPSTPIDPASTRALIRRIDYHIMPLICIVYVSTVPRPGKSLWKDHASKAAWTNSITVLAIPG